MTPMDRVSRTLRALGVRIATGYRGHPRIAAVGAGSAATAAAVIARRRVQRLPSLPDPAVLGAATAASVGNAAKASVIAAVREHEAPDRKVVMDAVRRAVADAAASGTELTAAAIGAVEGAIAVAGLIDEQPRALADAAADAARFAAGIVGPLAARRVGETLAPFLRP